MIFDKHENLKYKFGNRLFWAEGYYASTVGLYMICNTYSEWENHVKEIVNTNIFNRKDFLHWLYDKRNFEELMS